jgi:hypothetical protein
MEGYVLASNAGMLKLCAELGFKLAGGGVDALTRRLVLAL